MYDGLIKYERIKETLPIQDFKNLSNFIFQNRSEKRKYLICGSSAKGTRNRFSDIDVLVVCSRNNPEQIEKIPDFFHSKTQNVSIFLRTEEYLTSFESELHYWSKITTAVCDDQTFICGLIRKLARSIKSTSTERIAVKFENDLVSFKKQFCPKNSELATTMWLICHAAPLLTVLTDGYENIAAKRESIDQLIKNCVNLELRDKMWLDRNNDINVADIRNRPFKQSAALDLAKCVWERLPINGESGLGI
jgi:predicted nucleotidyltransferase